jgi:hypothetical protein
VARWRITQATSFSSLVAALPEETRRALADVYRVLSQGPLPGESVLQVEPLPGAPDTYTVPFAGAGFLVYMVDQPRRTVELVGMIWLGF